jgi:hypothetical protein
LLPKSSYFFVKVYYYAIFEAYISSTDRPLTKYIVRTGDSAEDDEDELLKHKELIILTQAVEYCETMLTDRIRYRKLRQISNDRLTTLTDGEETDFGGNFEVYLLKFEKEYEHHIGLVKRIRESKKTTFIIPDIPKIIKLFTNFKLHNFFEGEAIIKKPIPIEFDDNYLPSEDREQDLDGNYTGRLVDYIFPPGVYTARYYYRNGHPVFLNQGIPTSPFASIDSDPFYKKTNYLYHHYLKSEQKEGSLIFVSDKLNIRLLSSEKRI